MTKFLMTVLGLLIAASIVLGVIWFMFMVALFVFPEMTLTYWQFVGLCILLSFVASMFNGVRKDG